MSGQVNLVILPVGDKNLQLIQSNTSRAVLQVQQYEAVAANWVDPEPTTISEAIDRMAALLVTLNGGPIP
jgi:hypothetical protein